MSKTFKETWINNQLIKIIFDIYIFIVFHADVS